MHNKFLPLFLLLQSLLFISNTIYEDSVKEYNRSSDLYFDQEYKFTPDALLLTNTTPAYEKRIFAIEFDENKFCKNSYYKVSTSEVSGISYYSNVTDKDNLEMLTSVFIESKQILLTLDKYMNLHQFIVNHNGNYERKYIQMIQRTEQTSQLYSNAWLLYSKTQDVVIGLCKDFSFTIFLSDILASNKTSPSLLNLTEINEIYKDDLLNMIQVPDNSSQFLLVYKNAFNIFQIKNNSDKTLKLQYLTGYLLDQSSIRDASMNALNIYVLTGDSKIQQYSHSLNDITKGFELKKTYSIPTELGQATFMVTKIGSTNPKVDDKLFFIGGYLAGMEYNQEILTYCVVEYILDSSKLVYNREYCSDEDIEEIIVQDRFAFVRRKSIHQLIYHSIPQEVMDSSKTQNYLISQQVMHATFHQKDNFSYYLIAVQYANQYSISINFLEEEHPKLICLADEDQYGEGDYNLLYKMKTSHCTTMKTSTQNSCKLYQSLSIDLKEYDSNSKTGLIIGIVIGSVVIIIIAVLGFYFFLKKKFELKYEQLKEGYEQDKYHKNQQYQSPQPVKQDDVQLQL